MTYITSSSTNSGVSTITVTFDIGRDPDLAAVDVQNRVNQALGRMPAEVRTNGITVTKNTRGLPRRARVLLEGRPLRRAVHQQLRRRLRAATRSSACPASATSIIFGERKFAMRLWLDPPKLAARKITRRRRRERAARAERPGRGGRGRRRAGAADQMYQISVRADGPAHRGRRSSRTSSSRPATTARWCASATSAASSWAPRPTRRTCGSAASNAAGVGIQLLPTANALEAFRRRDGRDGAARAQLPAGARMAAGLRQRRRRARVDRRGAEDAGRGDRPGHPGDVPVPAELAQHDHPGASPFRSRSIGTFAFVKLFGFSINTLTLFGIVLATGIVVDDAIVVIENIERHMREYRKSARAGGASTRCARCSARSSSSASCWSRCSCRSRSSRARPAGSTSSSR